MSSRQESKNKHLITHTGVGYFPLALVARLPFAMMVVGVITLVVSARDSLTVGGATAAAVGVGNVLFGPVVGVAVDRYGQRGVLLVFGTLNSVLLMSLAWVAFASFGEGWIYSISFLIGASSPQVSPLSRSRLITIIDRSYEHPKTVHVLNGTMAYESAADETAFVFGPLLVGLLATTLGPAAPVIGAGLLALVFVSAFALHKTASVTKRSASVDTHAAPITELFKLRTIAPILGAGGVGLFFGAMLTSLSAFLAERGQADQIGLVYSLLGIGSGIMALSIALLPAKFSHEARWVTFSVITVAGGALLFSAQSVGVISICLLVMGIGIGPTLVSQYSLAAKASPLGRLATVMTLVGSSITLWQSGATWFTAQIAESHGTAASFAIPFAAAIFILTVGIVSVLASRR